MAKKTTSKANGKATKIGLELYRLPAPAWQTPEDAREWLSDDVRAIGYAFEDIVNTGAGLDWAMLRDFAELVEAAAEFAEERSPVLDHDDQRTGTAAAYLAGVLQRLCEALDDDGLTIKGADPHNEIEPGTVELVHSWLRDAVRAEGVELRYRRRTREAEERTYWRALERRAAAGA